MDVNDEEARIEDELEILSPFLQNTADSLPYFLGEFGLENYKIQEVSLQVEL